MARFKKRQSPPSKTIQPLTALVPLMQAFHVDSDDTARALISQAANAVYGSNDFGARQVSDEEIDCVMSLMRGLKPKDTLETLCAAQIIVCNLLGMRKLSENYFEDQNLGLKLLKFGNEAMQGLEKKRNGGVQNITVNYNHNGPGNALMQALVSNKED